MLERFDSIQTIVLFGSFARGEEKVTSDFDAYLIFDRLTLTTLVEVGKSCKDFFPRYERKVSYPMCFTMDDFYNRDFKKVFADPIKYFEAVVTYGSLPITPPSREKVAEFCNDILREAAVALRYSLLTDRAKTSDQLSHVVKLFAIALKLERYLTTNQYPKTSLELEKSLEGTNQSKVAQWFQSDSHFQKKFEEDKSSVVNQLFQLLNQTQDDLASILNSIVH
jgi:predicted nucleotidyltransferase